MTKTISSGNSDYKKCIDLVFITKIVSEVNTALAKGCLKKALKYADINQMYTIAREVYVNTEDKDYSTKIYKKVIKKCLKSKQASKLNSVGNSMIDIDVSYDNYFTEWSKELNAQVKEMLHKQQQRGKQDQITYSYDSQSLSEISFNQMTFHEGIKELFFGNSPLEEDEIICVIKAHTDETDGVISHGAYFGMDMSPFTFLVNSKESSEEVFLAEASCEEAILEFIQHSSHNRKEENIYVIKIQYQNFKISNIKSIYGGPFELDFYVFYREEDGTSNHGEVLKRLGRVNYIPSINYF